ncbi:MAG: hypothetical protein JOS17DRAFT_771867 [Linnemannia elongata]|nr:MAG: hypothetical protein JOS17DRAFT_779473 [Linnemannia elongata]KAK3836335.1 MAG: hypothetical protein JOS17DRAFT_771867 [Linnemannia elongata]
MREELRRRQTTRDEQPERLQSTRYRQYAEKDRAYFEHIIAEVQQDNVLSFRTVADKDELAKEELYQVDAGDNGQNNTHGGGNSPGDSLSRDGSGSSPIADADLYTTAQTLKLLAGGSDVVAVDGIKEFRQNAQGGSEKAQGVRKAMKQLVHACVALRDEELQSDEESQQQ